MCQGWRFSSGKLPAQGRALVRLRDKQWSAVEWNRIADLERAVRNWTNYAKCGRGEALTHDRRSRRETRTFPLLERRRLHRALSVEPILLAKDVEKRPFQAPRCIGQVMSPNTFCLHIAAII